MAPRFHERWLEPFCVLLPLAVVSRLDPAALQPARLRRLGLAVCLCAAGLTVARAGQIWYGGSARGITPFDLSFDAAAARIRPAAPPGSVLISRDRGLAGNLRQHIPGLSCLCLDLPLHTPPRVDGRANRVLVWDATRQRSVPDSLLAYARGAAGIGARKAGPARFVELPCLPVAQPSRLLGWLVIPGKGSSPAFPYAGYSVSSRKLTAASARLQR